MLKQVTYVTLFVRDQDKALDFYINTLGFEKREENPAGRVRFVTVGLKGQDLQVVLWPGTPGKARPTVRFSVESVGLPLMFSASGPAGPI